jgi:hypothetical protein
MDGSKTLPQECSADLVSVQCALDRVREVADEVAPRYSGHLTAAASLISLVQSGVARESAELPGHAPGYYVVITNMGLGGGDWAFGPGTVAEVGGEFAKLDYAKMATDWEQASIMWLDGNSPFVFEDVWPLARLNNPGAGA